MEFTSIAKVSDKAHARVFGTKGKRTQRNGRSRPFFMFLFVFLTALAGPAFADPNVAVVFNDAGSDPIPAGGTIVYNLQIRNDGDMPSDPTTVTFDIPANARLTGGTAPLTGCTNVGTDGPVTVTCDVPALVMDEAIDLNPEVLTLSADPIRVDVEVIVPNDADPSNNSTFETTTVNQGADISLSVAGPNPNTVPSGSLVSYVFTAENLGPNDSNGFTFVFPVPVGLDNIVTPPGCTLTSGEYICEVTGIVPVGDAVTFTFDGQIVAGNNSTVTPSAELQFAPGQVQDGQPDNNIATIDTEVIAGSDVGIAKTISEDELLVGETAVFTLSPTYSGGTPTGLQITDAIPGNYVVTNIDDSGSGFDCSASAGNLVDCSLASGGVPGANVSLGDIVITVDVVSSGAPENIASISSDGPDPNPANDVASDDGAVIEDPTVDHEVTKAGPSTGLVAVGSEYDFVLGSNNIGNSDFFGTLVLEDTIPAGMTLTGVDASPWTCTETPIVATGETFLRCTLDFTEADPLVAGTSAPSVTTTVLVTELGSFSNFVRVSAEGANIEDVNQPNDVITVGVTSQEANVSPDLAISKTARNPVVASGELQIFDIEIANLGPTSGSGPFPAQNVMVTDAIRNLINDVQGAGGGLESISISQGVVDPTAPASCGATSANSRGVDLTCTIPTLPMCTPGVDCPVVTVTVRPGSDQINRPNTARVFSNTTADSNPNNNTSTAVYDVTPQVDLQVSKTALPDPARTSVNLQYNIVVENNPVDASGNPIVLSTAQNVVVTDDLPDGMIFVSANAVGGTCTAPAAGALTSGDQVTCTFPTLENASQRTITIVARPTNALLGADIINDVQVVTDTVDIDPSNDTDQVITSLVDPAYDLLVNKVGSLDPVGVGEQLTYTISLVNQGPSVAENVVLTDDMPTSDISFDSVNPPAGVSCSVSGGTPSTIDPSRTLGSTITCTIPVVLAFETVEVEIVAFGDSKGSGVNNASVVADLPAFETNTGNNNTELTTTVRNTVDVRVNSKTANPGVIDFGEDFEWIIEVENVEDATQFFGEADDVFVTDTLPANMILTGPPTTADGTCTGGLNDTGFSCDLGTMAVGQVTTITVPVRVTDVSAEPQEFDNAAEITTSSRDVDETNNSNSGTVEVNSSSVSGEVFFDFNDDGVVDPGDFNTGGISVTLSGTSVNGLPIERTIVVPAGGQFSFDFLPAGDYTLTRTPVTEDFQTAGTNTLAGAGGGAFDTADSPSFSLGLNEDRPDNLFAIVPQARIGLAKAVTGAPVINPNGTFDVTFGFVVENFSLEALNDVSLSDTLSGGSPLFGNNVADPAAVGRGEYAILTAPNGTCSGTVGGFTGSGAATDILSGGTIAAESFCEVSITLRINPASPFPPELAGGEQYQNTANVDGTGALSGQNSATNPLLADTSDDGTNADTGNDGAAGGPGEDDPTPVTVDFNSELTLTKEVDTSGLSAFPVAGEQLTYLYVVENTGDFTVFDIEVTDVAANFTGTGTPVPTPGAPTGGADLDGEGDLPDLNPDGGTITYSATYTLTQEDIDTGFVNNTAEVTGTDVFGEDVEDASNDPIAGNGPEGPTVATLPRSAELTVAKTIEDQSFSTPLAAGDTIDYQFVVTNTGNVGITAVSPADPGPAFNNIAGTGTLSPFVTADPIDLLPLEAATFTATYTLTAADVANLRTAADPSDEIVNVADATGTAPTGTELTTQTDTTATGVAPVPGIELVKTITDVQDTNANGLIGDVGDVVLYTLTATNTGDTSLSNVGITDVLLGLTDVLVTPAALAPGESGVLADQAYAITPANFGAGQVENTADVSGTPVATNADGTPDASTPLTDPGGALLPVVQDTSDTETEADLDADGNPVATPDPDADGNDTPTVLNLPTFETGIVLVKEITEVRDTNGNNIVGDTGDEILYTLTVTNTGTVALAGVTITDVKLELDEVDVTPVDLLPGASGQIVDQIHVIDNEDQAAGQVVNTATTSGTAVATGPDGLPDPGTPLLDENGVQIDPLVDTSDTLTDPDLDENGDIVQTVDPDGDGDDNPTVLNLPATGPRIALEKAIVLVEDLNGNGQFGDVGDRVTYDLTVINTGNTALANIVINDALLGLVDVAPSPDALPIDGVATLKAQTYIITPEDQAAGQVLNTADVAGTPVATDDSGNPNPSIPLLGTDGLPLAPVVDTSDTQTQADLDADGNPVDVPNPDGDGTDGPTLLNLPAITPELTLTKAITSVVDANGTGLFGDVGDTITYDLIVTNTGNVSLAGVAISDINLGLVDELVSPADLAPNESATFSTQPITITAEDQAAGQVINTATTDGQPVATGPNNTPLPGTPLVGAGGDPLDRVEDTSDTQTEPDLGPNNDVVDAPDPDGDGGDDDQTVLNLPVINAEITLIKSIVNVQDVNNNNLFGDTGDFVTYELTVTNTGNTALAGVTVTDALLGLNNFPISPADLAIGASATLPLQDYEITPEDQAAGEVLNTATTQGQPVATDPDTNLPDPNTPLLGPDGNDLAPVVDTSDTQTDPELDADGNPVTLTDPNGDGPDTPTVLNLPATEPEITLVKSIIDVQDLNETQILGDVGDGILYSLTATNTGNAALADIVLNDDKLGLVDVALAPNGLVPGESVTFAPDVYLVTPSDQAAGQVLNTANVNGSPVATDDVGNPDLNTPLVDEATGLPLEPVADISDTLTEPDLDADGNPISTANPNADGLDSPTLLILPEIAAEITLVKSITNVRDVNSNGLLGDVGDEVTYALTVTNTGNTALAGVTISDDLLGLVDAPVSPLNLAIGQSGTIAPQLHLITAAEQATGQVLNTATTSGQPVATNADTNAPDPNTPLIGPDGADLAPVVDISDTLTDPDLDANGDPVPTGDPAADGTDNPTLLNLPAVSPSIELVKAITEVQDVNGNGQFGDVGDIVIYSLTATNTGNTALVAVGITDVLLGLENAPIDPADLLPGETGTLEGQPYTITPADVGRGVIENTAEVAGTAVATTEDGMPDPNTPLLGPSGGPLAPVVDTSDTGTNPDLDENGEPVLTGDPAADGDDNPTLLNLPAPAPLIELVKVITEVQDVNNNNIFGDVGDLVLYSLTATNSGNTSLAAVGITDALLVLENVLVDPENLAPGESGTLEDQPYTITAQDVGRGVVENTAEAAGTAVATGPDGAPDPDALLLDPTGAPLAPVVDTSDTGTNADLDENGDPVTTGDPTADGDDNPTLLNLPTPEPGITLVKSVLSVDDSNQDSVLGNVGDAITYIFTSTNTGNTSLSDVSISDPLLGLASVPTDPVTLAPGESATLQAELTITEEFIAAGFVENTATTQGTAVATGADGTPDVDTPLVGDNGDPLAPVTDISDTGSQPDTEEDGTIIPVADPAAEGTGDDPTLINLPLVPSPFLVSGTVFFDANRDSLLDAQDDPTGGAGFVVNLLDENGIIFASTTADEDGFYEFTGFPAGTYTVQFVDLDGAVAGESDPVSLNLSNPIEEDVDFPILAALTPDSIALDKTTPLGQVTLGSSVPYVISITNASLGSLTTDVVDSLPTGFVYTPDSATLDGVSVDPVDGGSSLTFLGIDLAAGQTRILELVARVGPDAPTGQLTNTVRALDPETGAVISNTASASVTRDVEAIFDCSDVIGKVFDDRNFDGYQNSVNSRAVSNQDLFGNKGKLAPATSSQEEPGLPRVRLVTPTGTIITTDEYGRYSVPCAELPRKMGTNFTLKLDERSLPTGYRVTTENPRVMRLTAGIMTELNFGAAIGRVIDIDLTSAAFTNGKPVDRLVAGIERLLPQVATEPSVIRLSYFSSAGEARRDARARLDRLEKHIQRRWKSVGKYRLLVETNIKSLQ